MNINWKQLLVKLSGISSDVTKRQQKRIPYKNESGKESPLQAEFTGDKFPKSGDPAKKDVSSWREQNALGNKLNSKANPAGGQSPNKESNWRELGSALTNSVAGRAELVDKHEELAKGSEPEYKVGTFGKWRKLFQKKSNEYFRCPNCGYEGDTVTFGKSTSQQAMSDLPLECPKCSHRFPLRDGDPVVTGGDPFKKNTSMKTGTKFRVGAKFASRVTKKTAILQDMGTYAKFKDKVAAGQCKYVSPTGEVAPANENLVVVAYVRPEANDGVTLLASLGQFVASFEHKADYESEGFEPEGKVKPEENAVSEDKSEVGINDTDLCEVPEGSVAYALGEDGHPKFFTAENIVQVVNEFKGDIGEPTKDTGEIKEEHADPNDSDKGLHGESAQEEKFKVYEFLTEHYRGRQIGDKQNIAITTIQNLFGLSYDEAVQYVSNFVNERTDSPMDTSGTKYYRDGAGLHRQNKEREGISSQTWRKLAVSPPHSEYTVHELKKSKAVDNPFALAWWMKNKGMKLHDAKPKESNWKSVLMSMADEKPEPAGKKILENAKRWDAERKQDKEYGEALVGSAGKKPYYCSTCDSGFSEGQMNFHKSHEYEKRGEKVEDESSEEYQIEKEDKAQMDSKQAGVEFQKKPDGTINIDVTDPVPGAMQSPDTLNGQPMATPQPPASAGADVSQVPEPTPPAAKGKKASYTVGSTVKDAELGEGTIESISGQEVIASFSGKKYKTTLSALG